MGFNAPETRHAECQAELDLGARATRRLRDLIKLGNLDFAMSGVLALRQHKVHLRAITEEAEER